MLAPQEGNDSLEVDSTLPGESAETSPKLPCFEESLLPPIMDAHDEEPSDQHLIVRPLSELVFDEQSELILDSDDETSDRAACPLHVLATFLHQPEPLTWLFAGVRLMGNAASEDGRLTGEWFAEEWRAESGRATDVVIDATWPECTLAVLKSHLKTRVVRHRPNVAILFLDRSDATAGVEQLPQFERRLVAVLSVLSEIGTTAVLVQTPMSPVSDDIDAEIFFEAIAGIARERDIPHLVLPSTSAQSAGSRKLDSLARTAALDLCREVMRAF
jgi:hypothetical protein